MLFSGKIDEEGPVVCVQEAPVSLKFFKTLIYSHDDPAFVLLGPALPFLKIFFVVGSLRKIFHSDKMKPEIIRIISFFIA